MKRELLRRFYSLSLRTHLLLMTLLLALPAFLLIFYSGYLQSKDAIREGVEDAHMLGHSIASEQYNLTGNVEQLLTAVAQIPEIKRHDAKATSKILGDILQKNPQYGNIIVADRSGLIWASGLPMRRRLMVQNGKSLQSAIRTGRFSSGEYILGRVSGKPSIGFGYPISDAGGACSGAIMANINFSGLNSDLLKLAGLPPGSWFTITDCNGVIVNKSLDPAKYVGTRVKPELFLPMKNGPREESRIEPGDSDRYLVYYKRLRLKHEESPYLYVRVSIPLSETRHKALLALARNVALLSPFLLLTVLLVIRIGNASFLQRVGRLEVAARRMADGDLDSRVSDLFEGGELGRLGRAFDDMAQKLASREHALTELNQGLARRVEEETELRVQRERLLARHARLVAMGEMIGAIAHQWRQPLATVGAIVQSIRMAWERNRLDAAFLKKAEADAQKQLYYMSDTIEDFRNFFTPEKVAETFDVREKVHEVTMLVGARFVSACVALEVEDRAPRSPLHVKGYQNEFKQSLLNLVSNALDAVAEKAARDGLAPQGEGRVLIALDASGAKAVIEVRDNGCGIPEGCGERIFDPYFTTKPADQGTGIGLYMTRLIIEESMGGSISFASTREGTVFTVELSREDISGESDGR